MKQRTNIHRKIYKQHYGEIPVDSDGRTYDIHHIDGDDSNNDISNLIAVSIKEHYVIHEAQSDWGACIAIEMRMGRDPDLISDLNRKKVEEGTHHLLGGEIQSASWRANYERARELNRLPHQIKKTCSYCGITCSTNMFGRFHGERCLKNPNNTEIRVASNRKKIHTSDGIFDSRLLASKHFKITPQAVGLRCKNTSEKWSDWYYL
jgi:hypothetical protein